MSSDGGVEIVLGLLFTVGGVVSLLMPAIPFICIGALIAGPIMLFSGIAKMAGGGRRPAYGPTYGRYSMPPGTARLPVAPGAAAPLRPVPPPVPAASLTACPRCGAAYVSGAKFCSRCGQPA